MYVDTSNVVGPNGKTYTRHLLRESYREDGRVKKRTVGNVSHLPAEDVEVLRLALSHKEQLRLVSPLKHQFEEKRGPPVGAVMLLRQVCGRLGIADALGPEREGKLALWQVVARALDTRLAPVRGPVGPREPG